MVDSDTSSARPLLDSPTMPSQPLCFFFFHRWHQFQISSDHLQEQWILMSALHGRCSPFGVCDGTPHRHSPRVNVLTSSSSIPLLIPQSLPRRDHPDHGKGVLTSKCGYRTFSGLMSRVRTMIPSPLTSKNDTDPRRPAHDSYSFRHTPRSPRTRLTPSSGPNKLTLSAALNPTSNGIPRHLPFPPPP